MGGSGTPQSRHHREPGGNIVRLRHCRHRRRHARAARVFSLSPAASERRSRARCGARCSARSSSAGPAIATEAATCCASSACCICSPHWAALLRGVSSSFIVWRFLAGIAIGGSSVLAPVYLAEIAPANRRGALVGLFQVNIVIGILLAYGSNFCVAQIHRRSGRVAIQARSVGNAGGRFLCRCCLTIPHSPRWLVAKARLAEAEVELAPARQRRPARRVG